VRATINGGLTTGPTRTQEMAKHSLQRVND